MYNTYWLDVKKALEPIGKNLKMHLEIIPSMDPWKLLVLETKLALRIYAFFFLAGFYTLRKIFSIIKALF